MNTSNFSPNTHIFLWDLHDVILEKNMWNWFMTCLRFNRKKEILYNLNKKSLKIALTFLLERLQLTKKQMVSEELIASAKTTNNDALIELIMLVCSAYTPINKTVQIMHDLSDLGYTHHLGSNIGKTVYDDCANKFPHIFNVFKQATIPFESTNAIIIKKPHPDFFNAHLTKYNIKPHHIIFIDDKLTNVHAAQSVGMHAIHFKNPQQLRQNLIQYGILKN